MSVRLTAALAIVALAVQFCFKTAGAVWPALFGSLPLAQASSASLLAGSLLMLLFFAALRSRLEAAGHGALAAASRIAMAGAGIGGLVALRSLLVSVDLATPTREAIAAGYLGDASAAVALLWFFVALHRGAPRWLRGTGLAIAGCSLLVALAVAVFVLQVTGEGLDWLGAWSHLPAVVLATVAALAVAGPLRFLVLVARDPSPLLA